MHMVFLYEGGVAVFDNLVARLRAEMLGFLLFIRAANHGGQK